MTFDKIGGIAYVRSGYTNNSGSGTYNKIFMARLAVEASPIAPDAVADLVVASPEQRALTLTWTVPADATAVYDGPVRYDIRYSTAGPIDDTNWDAATPLAGEPPPGPTGAIDAMRVSGLTAATDYYFALKSIDTAGNVSLISNCAMGRTEDAETDATGRRQRPGLQRSAHQQPGAALDRGRRRRHDPASGPAVSYDLRYSLSPIDDANFAAATPIAVAAPRPPAAPRSSTCTT